MKNDLTTGAWQHNIGCPISITLISTSDVGKEMKDVRLAFKCLNPGERTPLDYKWIKCHMIFDIKIEDFRRKAHMVAGGHMTSAPTIMTYASMVSRETIIRNPVFVNCNHQISTIIVAKAIATV
jgi:hypothetical protein